MAVGFRSLEQAWLLLMYVLYTDSLFNHDADVQKAAGLSALVLNAHGTRATRDDAAAFARRRIIAGARSIKRPGGSGIPA